MNKNCKEKHRTAEEVYCCLTCTPHKEDKLTQLTDLLADKTLSFGCRLQNNWSDSHKPYVFIRKAGKNTVTWSEQFKQQMLIGAKRIDDDREPFEIIGHPVTLARVLEMWEEKHNDANYKVKWKEHWSKMPDIVNGWDFKKDTLDQQPPETINYLAELFLSPNNK